MPSFGNQQQNAVDPNQPQEHYFTITRIIVDGVVQTTTTITTSFWLLRSSLMFIEVAAVAICWNAIVVVLAVTTTTAAAVVVVVAVITIHESVIRWHRWRFYPTGERSVWSSIRSVLVAVNVRCTTGISTSYRHILSLCLVLVWEKKWLTTEIWRGTLSLLYYFYHDCHFGCSFFLHSQLDNCVYR